MHNEPMTKWLIRKLCASQITLREWLQINANVPENSQIRDQAFRQFRRWNIQGFANSTLGERNVEYQSNRANLGPSISSVSPPQRYMQGFGTKCSWLEQLNHQRPPINFGTNDRRCLSGQKCVNASATHWEDMIHPSDGEWKPFHEDGPNAIFPCPFAQRRSQLDPKHFDECYH